MVPNERTPLISLRSAQIKLQRIYSRIQDDEDIPERQKDKPFDNPGKPNTKLDYHFFE